MQVGQCQLTFHSHVGASPVALTLLEVVTPQVCTQMYWMSAWTTEQVHL